MDDLTQALTLAQEQALRYAQDLARLYQQEREKREQLALAHQKLSAILQSIASGLVVVDQAFRVTEVNPAFCALVEREEDELIGLPLTEAMPGIDPTLPDQIRQRDQSIQTHEIQLVHPQERTLIARVSRLEKPSHAGWVIVLHDVTQERRTANLKHEFVSIASHELRTPLTGIIGYAQLLADQIADRLDDDGRMLLDHVLEAADRLKGIVDELIAFTEVADLPFTSEPLDLRDLVQDALMAVTALAQRRSVTLDLTLPDEPAIMQGDWASLRKALIHILDNAITYNKPQGEVRVTLGQEEGIHLITVADTGIGIPQVELSRIFEPFYQVEEHNTRRYGGLGLGLAIARRAVELHGGRIWAESRLNEGSTFYIALPTLNGSATNGNDH